MKKSPSAGFTLLELLLVVGLIAAMTAGFVGSLNGRGDAGALLAAQTSVANLVTAARTKAGASGRKTRLLFAADPAAPSDFLRRITLQLAPPTGSGPTDWLTVIEVRLPEGVYVVPPALNFARGLVSRAEDWKRISDVTADLVSDLFQGPVLRVSLPGESTSTACLGVAFTPNGTLAAPGSGPPPKGSIVLALGRKRPVAADALGDSPVQLVQPQAVRGLILSAYGVPGLLNEREAF